MVCVMNAFAAQSFTVVNRITVLDKRPPNMIGKIIQSPEVSQVDTFKTTPWFAF